jgi:hypothetical protein
MTTRRSMLSLTTFEWERIIEKHLTLNSWKNSKFCSRDDDVFERRMERIHKPCNSSFLHKCPLIALPWLLVWFPHKSGKAGNPTNHKVEEKMVYWARKKLTTKVHNISIFFKSMQLCERVKKRNHLKKRHRKCEKTMKERIWKKTGWHGKQKKKRILRDCWQPLLHQSCWTLL